MAQQGAQVVNRLRAIHRPLRAQAPLRREVWPLSRPNARKDADVRPRWGQEHLCRPGGERRVANTLNQFVYYPPRCPQGQGTPLLQERQQGLICIRVCGLWQQRDPLPCLSYGSSIIQLSGKDKYVFVSWRFVCVSN